MNITPPRPKGPPLNALRAFETSARRGSFTAAADELCVTPGAVAQHIKTLEAWTGAALFKRQAHGVSLTALGHDVLPRFITAFDSLGEAVQSLRSQATPEQIRIAALPSIAQCWLSPRLPRVRKQLPGVSISVYALDTKPNLKREQFDLSIYFETLPGDDDNIEICRDTIFPVCSPEIAGDLKTPADLASLTYLHDSQWSDDWQSWMQEAAPNQSIDTEGSQFSLFSLALEEAKNSAGVLIAHEALVQSYLDSGELVAPFETKLVVNNRLSISTLKSNSRNSVLEDLIQALLQS